MSDHARIISRYQALLGAEHVLTHPEALAAAETATFATRTRIPAILRPADRVEVQACVRLAGELGCALYPISRGKNWGLGSRVPTRDGALLLDLGRLDRILEYNEEMAYVTLEPGVSFGQLTQFLAERGGRHFVSMTGSTLDSSVIGNTLERGDGVGPLGDRAAHVCALEIVLADGQVIETGLARFPGAKAAPLYRWGVGPRARRALLPEQPRGW
jgi:4-cresol dehydrogenase (hydroxylating)